ncbi:Methenyltetrahydrofolate cyclohydrolase [uncultured Clostridium sp.]|uniref:cyclodeaminase/cyclohydrolase family protein n=1 Tax=uncultured Clostridium sp. TaxID=59620 RepID=UPI00082038C3|nr:cyclodeaminase/cyclohydrolase family protein [uncultured Clostridium sp.]SCK03064.1 Methenyltetrahydrofolate cyclohydrolase [uncultured Clostridium sp.]
MFKECKIEGFIEILSSSEPTPGGGTVAALLASISSSLVNMVYNITIDKKIFSDLDKSIKSEILLAKDRIDNITNIFLKLMDDDSRAFNKVMEAFKLPKSTEEEKVLRKHKIQDAYKEALYTPLQTVRESYKLYDYIYIACKYGNKNAITDIAVAALSLQSAIEGATLNVRINAKYIDDKEYTNLVIYECNEIIKNGIKKRNEILKLVEIELES